MTAKKKMAQEAAQGVAKQSLKRTAKKATEKTAVDFVSRRLAGTIVATGVRAAVHSRRISIPQKIKINYTTESFGTEYKKTISLKKLRTTHAVCFCKLIFETLRASCNGSSTAMSISSGSLELCLTNNNSHWLFGIGVVKTPQKPTTHKETGVLQLPQARRQK
jgi:hypothetical protein